MDKPLEFDAADFLLEVRVKDRDGNVKTAAIDVVVFNDDYFDAVKDIDPDLMKGSPALIFGVYRKLVAAHLGVEPDAIERGIALRIAQACFAKMRDAKKKEPAVDTPDSAGCTDSM